MKTRMTQAERRRRTSDELIAAADRLFVKQGFHVTSVEQIATDAGFSKGAVYSNFESKDALFLAVYERRVERAVAETERLLADSGPGAGLQESAARSGARRGRKDEDGWLAVFFEFWAHVVRVPESRRRFAEIHARMLEPMFEATRVQVEAHGARLPESAEAFSTAMYAMQLGLALERLTLPEIVDAELGGRMVHHSLIQYAGQRDLKGDAK